MAEEKLTISQWGIQYTLGVLRGLIDEGIESPGIGEALKNRNAAILKFILTVTKANLPAKPKFGQLELIPDPYGTVIDFFNYSDGETIESNTDEALVLYRWVISGISSNKTTTVVLVSRHHGVDP